MSDGLNSFGKKGEKNLLKWSTDEKKICSILEKMGFGHTKNEKVLMKNKGKASIFANFQKNEEGEFYLTGSNVDVELMPEFIAFRGFQQHQGMWIDGKTVELKDSAGVTKQIMVIPTSEKAIVEEKEKEIKEEKKEISKEGKKPMPSLEKIREIVGNDVLMIFGATGSGKSKIAVELAKEALNNGKKVFFLDSERNLSNRDIKELGNNYRYTPVFNEIKMIIENKLPKADLYILDSIGFPVLVAFSRLSLKQRGDALLTMISILGTLKERCYRENSIAIVTNQPISELSLMGRGELTKEEKDEELKPFGGKTVYSCKEIWRTDVKKGKDRTIVTLNSWRSREMGYGTTIAEVEISSKGVKFEWKI